MMRRSEICSRVTDRSNSTSLYQEVSKKPAPMPGDLADGPCGERIGREARMTCDIAELRHALESRVLDLTGRRVLDLDIEVRQDRVILHGRTKTYHVKQLAQEGVLECLPEVDLENAIEVCR